MLTIFFTIIFIAELIIAFWVISLIQKCNRLVCEANKKVTNCRVVIKRKICDIRISINSALLAMNNFSEFVNKKKDDLNDILSKNLFTTVLLMILNPGGKKIFALINFFLSVKKFIQKKNKH